MRHSVALEAWNEWRARVGLASIDTGSQRLLPLLWDNLRRQGVDLDDPDIRPLLRSYRLTLTINRLLFQEISRQLRALHGAGFPTMLLKGAALTVHYYKDYGLRPMGDFDVLIPTARTEDVLRFLQTNGWDPVAPLTRGIYAALSASHPFPCISRQQQLGIRSALACARRMLSAGCR